MRSKKVWIIDYEKLSHEKETEIYESNNIEYRITNNEANFENDLKEFGKYAEVIITQVNFICDKKLINQIKNLKAVLTFGMGFNNVDLKAAQEKGVYVCNVPDYCGEEVADHTLALSLTLLRGIHEYNFKVKGGSWNPTDMRPLRRLSELTIGLLGFGQIAQKVAKRFKAFNTKVIAHDKFLEDSVFGEVDVESVSFEELLKNSDLLSLHIPLTPETQYILSEKNIRKMKKNSILINTCRGGVIDEQALVKLLDENHIVSAGLDVLEKEPPNGSDLIVSHNNTIVTPHAAFFSIEAKEEMQIKTAENAIRVMNNEKPKYVVNNL